ncbi:hypothetical protein [uncultured Dialister sp.]|jgi:hypothetical protein|uniref:hypothetical protein n=1 Tax=Dialister sp. TaxID=1955814 RepID=UPI0025DFE3A4|nr:hypothetical protein [uncultured Dialister sp.]
MEHNYLFDGVALLICLWFIKSYFLGKASTAEEKFIYKEAPRWLLYITSGLVCLTLLMMVAVDFGLAPATATQESTFRLTVVSLLLWLALVLYTKWNWGVHITDRDVRGKNNRSMLIILLLMAFLASSLR